MLTYDAELLDIPKQNNSVLNITLKNYAMRRVQEIKLHKLQPIPVGSDFHGFPAFERNPEGLLQAAHQIHLRDGQRLSASDEIRQLLCIPDRYEVLCVVALGHKGEKKSPRSAEKMKGGRIRYGKY